MNRPIPLDLNLCDAKTKMKKVGRRSVSSQMFRRKGNVAYFEEILHFFLPSRLSAHSAVLEHAPKAARRIYGVKLKCDFKSIVVVQCRVEPKK